MIAQIRKKTGEILIGLLMAGTLVSGCTPFSTNGVSENDQILLVEEIIIGLLFIAIIVGIVAQRLRVPYTIGLVLIGAALALRGRFDLQITPNLILALLIPPLVFEAAFHLNLNELRNNLTPILALAVPGVIITTLLVGGVVALGTGLPLPVALIFGALVSATDPVSITALFRRIGVPQRLQVILEGESLLNDGTAIVVYGLVISIALSGERSFNWSYSLVDFLFISIGGLAVGLILGLLASQIMQRVDDYLIVTTLTAVLAYGAYLVGEMLGVSGVLAVVMAGLVNGNIGPRGTSPTTRIVVFNFWESAAFLANTFVFLLIGLGVNISVLGNNWQPVVWAVGAVIAARAVTIYGLSWTGRDIPLKWQHILFWGGLRGAICLALALSLPLELGAARTQIQSMAFGVVLFTLLVQGLSMNTLVKDLRVVELSENQEEYQRRHARAVAGRASLEHVERIYRQGLISENTWKSLAPILKEHNKALTEAVREIAHIDPGVRTEELDTTRREYLRAKRSTFATLVRNGLISDEIYNQLITEVDTALTENQTSWPEFIMEHNINKKPINRLMSAIVQEQDVESAISALTKLGMSVTRLPSTGGFLGRRNATLFIGLHEGQEEIAVRSLSKSCRRRVEYIATPLEGSPLPFPSPTPITVGGATIFSFEVDRYEEF